MTEPPEESGESPGPRYTGQIAVSALEHHAYCARQAALIHLDGIFTDDRRTAEGQAVHSSVDTNTPHSRRASAGVQQVASLPVRSERLGLYGVCDQVEFTQDTAVPIEYKVGAYQPGGPADVQVAGQAMCLREAGMIVPYAAVFSYHDRRRHTVELTAQLLRRLEAVVEHIRQAWAAPRLPRAVNDKRCRRCSLREDCIPTLDTAMPRQPSVFTPYDLGAWDA